MSGFVWSYRSHAAFNHQPPVPTGLTAVSIPQPTGHTIHSPRRRTSSRPPSVFARLVWLCLRLRRQFSLLFAPMSGNVRFCPVLPNPHRFNHQPPVTTGLTAVFHRTSDQTYQTPAPQRPSFVSPIGNWQSVIGNPPIIRAPAIPYPPTHPSTAVFPRRSLLGCESPVSSIRAVADTSPALLADWPLLARRYLLRTAGHGLTLSCCLPIPAGFG